jgi:hypothetical protein
MVKRAAGLAVVGAAGVATSPAVGQEPKQPADPSPAAQAKDTHLASAIKNPQLFMLGEPVTFRLEGDGHGRDLVVTSALDAEGKKISVHLRSGTVRVFRVDASVDEFTKQGGLYWRFHDTQGKAKLKTPGAVVMMVREGYSTVRCYEMMFDFRC